MNSRIGSTLAISGALALLPAVLTPALAGKLQPVYPYRFTDLGRPGCNYWHDVRSYDVNEPDANGMIQIVAWDTYPFSGSVIWDATADGAVVSRADVENGLALAINDAGWTVVHDRDDSLYLDVPDLGRVDLLGPSSWGFSPIAAAINNSGQVVAEWGTSFSRIWSITPDGAVSDSVDLPGLVILDINDWGEMVGYLAAAIPDEPIVAWFENGELQVEALSVPGDYSAWATAINNFGEVVGFSSGGYIPWLWSPARGLAVLAGADAIPKDINDHGQIVGYYRRRNSEGYRACLWENGQLLDLSDLSGVGTSNFRLLRAHAINEAGAIVGETWTRDGGSYIDGSFLLTPNP